MCGVLGAASERHELARASRGGRVRIRPAEIAFVSMAETAQRLADQVQRFAHGRSHNGWALFEAHRRPT